MTNKTLKGLMGEEIQIDPKVFVRLTYGREFIIYQKFFYAHWHIFNLTKCFTQWKREEADVINNPLIIWLKLLWFYSDKM
jgi:hypothetical protein